MTWRIRLFQAVLVMLAAIGAPTVAHATAWCGGQTSNGCSCGKTDIYPCCDNGGNCTWYAWRSMCCHWGFGPGNWGDAKQWAGNGANHPDVVLLSDPMPNSIAVRTIGQYGHVAYVTDVSGGSIKVEEENCCDSCSPGLRIRWYNASYFNGGFLIHKDFLGPKCGNGKCEGGENCANCSQDCGGCCGNGACDNGESCDSCPNDCKCLPNGEMTAGCSSVRGWAWDPDNKGAQLSIDVQCNGGTQGSMTASGGWPGHDGHGFSWSVPPALKQGEICSASAVVHDSNSGGVTTLGPKSFVCSNQSSYEGIWTTTRSDAAGITAQLPNSAHEGLRHDHTAGYPYPLAGAVRSCTQPGLEAFAELRGELDYNLQRNLHRVELEVDGAIRQQWQGDAASQTALQTGSGQQVCITTHALDEVVVPEAQAWTLGNLRWRTPASPLANWWSGYSPDGAGLTLLHPAGDALRVQLRDVNQPIKGYAESWIDLPVAFDTVRYQLSGAGQGQLSASLRVGDTLLPAEFGNHTLTGLQAQTLALRVGGNGPQPPETSMDWRNVRVSRSLQHPAGPWGITWHDAWGLDAEVPEDATPTAVGLSLRLQRKSMNWWTTGAVSAALDMQGVPFERVRAVLHTEHTPGSDDGNLAAQLRIVADNSPILTVPVSGEAKALDLTAGGQRLQFVLALLGDSPDAPGSFAARLDGVEWLRRGWWSAPSPFVAGLRDDRLEGGGVRLEVVRAWGMTGQALQGFTRIHRGFAHPQTGVRLHYRQELDGQLLRVVVLLDGLPAAVFDDVGEAERDVELLSPGFSDLALLLTPKQAGTVLPLHQWADFTAVQTRDTSGHWLTLPTQPVAGPPGATVTGLGADAGAWGSSGDTRSMAVRTESPTVADAGCGTDRQDRAWPTFLGTMMLGLLLRWRRTARPRR